MTADLFALRVDANDPHGLARFWSGVLGRDTTGDGVTLPPEDDAGLRIRFTPTRRAKAGPNRMHLDLTSTSLEDQEQRAATALGLGARHIDVGQRPEEGHVVLADPEGNEFCVVEPGNRFLAGCGLVGAVSCDGSQRVGHFWSAALSWPLVWDQDQETAVRSPRGGPKVAWGGPPVPPKVGRNRLSFELSVDDEDAARAEVDRLVSLGARRPDPGPGDGGRVLLADPDGNEFWLLTAPV
jgi:catechol 2,3-dioxygenase-like lactoylglutathione lyase family enzyme